MVDCTGDDEDFGDQGEGDEGSQLIEYSQQVDLDNYCSALIDMIAQQVPEVQNYLNKL